MIRIRSVRGPLHFSSPIATDLWTVRKSGDRCAPRFYEAFFSRVVCMEKRKCTAFTREFMLREKTMGTRSSPTFFRVRLQCYELATIQPSSRTTRLRVPGANTKNDTQGTAAIECCRQTQRKKPQHEEPHGANHQKRHVAAQPQASPAKLHEKTTKLPDDTLRCGDYWGRH